MGTQCRLMTTRSRDVCCLQVNNDKFSAQKMVLTIHLPLSRVTSCTFRRLMAFAGLVRKFKHFQNNLPHKLQRRTLSMLNIGHLHQK